MSTQPNERANAHTSALSDIELLVLDVDGVLTDGRILLDAQGSAIKSFFTRDGFGLKLWHDAGRRSAIVTGRSDGAVAHRAGEIGISHVIEGQMDKSAGLDELTRLTGILPDRMAYLGDDWPDIGAMRRVALPMAVADAEPAVLEAASFITGRAGGLGAVRDAVEHLLGVADLIDEQRRRYDIH